MEYLAQYTMGKDLYSHYSYFGYDFHEALENPTHCALSICKGWSSPSPQICPVHILPLRLKQGRHFAPEQSNPTSSPWRSIGRWPRPAT